MSRSLSNPLLPLSVVLLVLTGLTLGAACKSESRCSSSEQCANGFFCNTESMSCEPVADAAPDDTADASPACPEETHSCAAPAPEGWSGPVVGTEVASDVELAACPDAFDAGEQIVFGGFVAEGGCSCDCPGLSSGVLCSNAFLSAREGTGTFDCNSTCFGACTISLPPTGVCQNHNNTEVTAAAAVRVSLGKVTNTGTCSPPIEGNDFVAAFAEQARYCSADPLPATCSGAGTCLPNASDAGFDSLCIFQAGDNECPTEYPEKRLRFEDLEDTRSCSSCTCSGPAVDSSCGGTVGFNPVATSNPTCSATLVTSSGPNCVAKNAGELISANYNPETDFACSQSGSELSGEATATGPVTFCCLAPPL